MEQKKLALIATKGSLDWAYPPFILASTAAALGYKVEIFCTFYGLELLKKDISTLQVSSLGNPAMPMPFPVPVMMQALPGMQTLMSAMMRNTMKKKNIVPLPELREACLEEGVKLIACQMTVDLFDLQREELLDDLDYVGAASFFEFAGESDICLYI